MVKPVVLDFNYKTNNHQTNSIGEPAISFDSILQEALQNNSEIQNIDYFSNNDHVEQSDVGATRAIGCKNENNRNENTINNNTSQDLSTPHNRKIADRRSVQKDDSTIPKPDVMQSLAPSLLHANTARAIVTDKNTNATKHSEYKRDVHVRNFTNAANSKSEHVTMTDSLSKKVGKESIQDVINQLQKLIDSNIQTKDARKSDVKQLIANLTALQNSGKKDLHGAPVVQHVVHANELSDNKNKRVVRKTDNDTVVAAGEKNRKSVRNIETSIVDAVKQKGKLEETPVSNKKVSQTVERNDSFIQVNGKQSTTVTSAEAKPVIQNELMQLLQRAKLMQEGEKTSLSLKLYPESLGKLSVNLGLEHGILSGRFVVESQEAKELLLQQLESIRWELEQSGVQVGEFEVNVKHQRQRDFSEITEISHQQTIENTEYEMASNRYMYHDGVLDVII